MSKARSVVFLDGHKIAVDIENGSSFLYDLTPRLKTMRFAELEDVLPVWAGGLG